MIDRLLTIDEQNDMLIECFNNRTMSDKTLDRIFQDSLEGFYSFMYEIELRESGNKSRLTMC